ncbi:hypothetical protein Tco_0965759 [Tanacetum coccineum]
MAWFKELKIHLDTLHNNRCEPETYKRNLLSYLEELDKLIDERVLKYGELRMKEREVQAIKEIEKWLKEREIQQQESLVTEGTTLEANLSIDGTTLDASLVTKDVEKILVDMIASDIANADIRPSYGNDTVSEVHHDIFENMFVHGIQNHEQLEYIQDTYVVNENNSNIIFDIPNMDPDRDKEEHNYVNNEQHRAFFASLINNHKCDVEKCMKVNREAQQANALLTKELERYKEKEKKCMKIKLLNDEISNLKSHACQNDKTFAKENEKYDEYVQPLLNRKNELEKKNQEFLKKINDFDNKLQKIGQTAQTLHMLLPKDESVHTGRQGLGFENQNDVENLFVQNKAKELASSLYNIDEMG